VEKYYLENFRNARSAQERDIDAFVQQRSSSRHRMISSNKDEDGKKMIIACT